MNTEPIPYDGPPFKIAMDEVDSSQIHSIGYHPGSQTLAVRFANKEHKPTSLYYYCPCALEVFAALMAAESKGSFFIKTIKCHPHLFPYQKIETMPGIRAE